MVYTRQTDELVPYVVETIKAAVERVLEALNNPCSSNPCSNGVCSAQNSTTYVCQCPQGFKVASLEPFKCEWAYTGKKVNG